MQRGLRCPLAALYLLLVCVCAVVSTSPIIYCPTFIEEGSTVTCDCAAPSDVTAPPTLTWPGYSVTSQLVLNDVRRTLNGTEYACQMTVNGVVTTAVYQLQVAYGPSNTTILITGQNPFPTNGSIPLTLTCIATEVNPAPRFLWSGVACDNGNQGDTCSFRPRPVKDDSKSVACIVTSNFVGSTVKSATTIFTVNLLYPPIVPPVVTSVDVTTGFLRTGDFIHCTVMGGKPVVSSVTFTCTNPVISDQRDVTDVDAVTGVTSVTSSLIVVAPGDGSEEIPCQCSAVWSPDVSLYDFTTRKILPVEYRASITNFTLNGVMMSLTVTENDVSFVDVTCKTRSRPRANITLSTLRAPGVLSLQADVTQTSYRLTPVTCAMTGMYICSVRNGVSGPDQKIVRLNVLCGPREANSSSNSTLSPPFLTRQGLTFTLLANPLPDTFVYSAVSAVSSSSSSDRKIADLFTTSCRKDKDVEYNVICHVTPRTVTSQDFGVYAVSVSNGLGSYRYFFSVQQEILPPPTTSQSSKDESDFVSTLVVIGIIVGTVFVIIVVVVTVYFALREDRQIARPSPGIEDKADTESKEFVEIINEAYVSTDTYDTNAKDQHITDTKLSASATPASSNQHEDVITEATTTSSTAVTTGNGECMEAQDGYPGRVSKSSKKQGAKVSFKLNSDADSSEGEEGKITTTLPQSSGNMVRAVVTIETAGLPRTNSSERVNHSFHSGDYADIDSIATASPRGKPGTTYPPQQQPKDCTSPETPKDSTSEKKPSGGRFSGLNEIVQQGSVKGPLGDIYSLVNRSSPKLIKAKSSIKTDAAVSSSATSNSDRRVMGSKGGHRVEANGLSQSRVPSIDFPEKCEAQKPGNSLKPVSPQKGVDSDADSDIYDEAMSPNVGSTSVLTTEL